jgi:hypothetical protein
MILATALLNVARLVGRGYAGTATNSSTTTLTDTNQKSTEDDYFNGGPIFMGSNVRTVTDYVNSTRVFTFPTLSPAPAVGSRYEVFRNNYNREELVAAVNQALAEIGTITQVDATIDVAADTQEYTIASCSHIVAVDVATADAAPWGWERLHFWEEGNGSLIFKPGKEPTDAGKTLRIWYNAPHAEVTADADVIANAIPAPRLYWTAAYYAAYNRSRVVESDEKLKDILQNAGARMVEMAQKHPIRTMTRAARLAAW